MGAARTLRLPAMVIALASITLLTMCTPQCAVQSPQSFPKPQSQWLSRKCPAQNCSPSTSNTAEVVAYYNTIDPTATKANLVNWKSANGFDSGGDVRAVYFNNGDLAIGRDMHCKQNGANVACYVTNYGPPPFANGVQNPTWPDSTQALSDAIATNNPFATVAMEFSPPNNVYYYAYDGQGNRLQYAALDGQGQKMIPHMCMACHGGTYNTPTHLPSGSSFLPFDLSNFAFSSQAGFTKDAQQEAFRQMNALVLATNPNPTNPDNPIGTLIKGWYHGAVNTPGTKADETFVPSGWVNPTQDATENQNATDVYTTVVKPYCRTCHVANQSTALDWTTYSGFKSLAPNLIQTDMFTTHDMPHAEVPYLSLQGNIFALDCFYLYQKFLNGQGQGC